MFDILNLQPNRVSTNLTSYTNMIFGNAKAGKSTLAYELYNVTNASEDDKATYRSLFSKKYRGEDSNGNHYDFTPEEINSLYNMKDRFIKKIK